MDWTPTLTIIISVIGLNLVTFFYLMSRMDGKFACLDAKFSKIDDKFNDLTKEMQQVRTDLTKEIQNVRVEMQDIKSDLTKEIQKNREDILWIKWRIDPHEPYHWKSLEEDVKEK